MGIKIELYNPLQDKTSIETILQGNEYYTEVFSEEEKHYGDCIYIAHYNDSVAGFLSFTSYIGRGTKTVIFVGEKYRSMGIGTALINMSDKILSKHEAVERSVGVCLDGDSFSLPFVKKHGYSYDYSEYQMERIGDFLPQSDIEVRSYEDEDFLKWHYIQEMAFFILRESVGISPSYYFAPNEGEYHRTSYMKNRNDRFVMIVNNEIAAVGMI